jgi:hypothetical protein
LFSKFKIFKFLKRDCGTIPVAEIISYLVCWLTGCTPKQKLTVNGVMQCNSSKSDCEPVTGNPRLNLGNAGNHSLTLPKANHKNIALTTVAIE